MGAGASTITVEEESGSASQPKVRTLKYDLTLVKEKSARSLGQAYRIASLTGDAGPHLETSDQWARLYRVKAAASEAAERLREKQKALERHSVVKDIEEKVAKDRAEAGQAEKVEREARAREEKLLSKAWHKVDSSRKYFTKAKNFISVSVFQNHNKEYVVAATLPHEDHETIHPIHILGDYLGGPAEDGDGGAAATLDDLRRPPVVSSRARDLLLRGNRLTITRSQSSGTEGRLTLELLDVPHRPAEEVVSPKVLSEIKKQTLEHWEPTPTVEMQLVAKEKFSRLSAGLEEDLVIAESAIVDVEAVHELLVKEAAELHEMNSRDAKVLSGLHGVGQTKRRRTGAHHRVVDRWDDGQARHHRAATAAAATPARDGSGHFVV